MATLQEFLKDFRISSYRECLIEHIFVADILQAAWIQGRLITVSKAETDSWGYDVVLSSGNIMRSVQLKSSTRNSLIINRALAKTPGGCVIVVAPKVENSRIRLEYKIFESGANRPLLLDEFKTAKKLGWRNEDGKAVRKERITHVRIPQAKFRKLSGAEELVERLFPKS